MIVLARHIRSSPRTWSSPRRIGSRSSELALSPHDGFWSWSPAPASRFTSPRPSITPRHADGWRCGGLVRSPTPMRWACRDGDDRVWARPRLRPRLRRGGLHPIAMMAGGRLPTDT